MPRLYTHFAPTVYQKRECNSVGSATPSSPPSGENHTTEEAISVCATMHRTFRSIAQPLLLTTIAVVLAIALLVGWTLVIVLSMDLAANVWLLVLGIVSFVFIICVLVTFGVILVLQIKEGRQQTRFVDSVTHELKTPLASLRLSLETLQRPDLPENVFNDLHTMMSGDVDRLSTFIDDILESSRLSQLADGAPTERVSLAHLVDACVSRVAKRHALEPDSIQVQVSPEIYVETERSTLDTILKNLLDNALKYSDDATGVGIRAQSSEKAVEIEVYDSGIGIPKSAQKKVFRRFYRVENERVRARSGTGLGLHIVAASAKHLRARVSVRCTEDPKQTIFTLVLPNQDAR